MNVHGRACVVFFLFFLRVVVLFVFFLCGGDNDVGRVCSVSLSLRKEREKDGESLLCCAACACSLCCAVFLCWARTTTIKKKIYKIDSMLLLFVWAPVLGTGFWFRGVQPKTTTR